MKNKIINHILHFKILCIINFHDIQSSDLMLESTCTCTYIRFIFVNALNPFQTRIYLFIKNGHIECVWS